MLRFYRRNSRVSALVSALAMIGAVIVIAAGSVAFDASARHRSHKKPTTPSMPNPSAIGQMPVPGSLNAPMPMGSVKSTNLSETAKSDCPNGSVETAHLPANVPAEILKDARPGQCFTRLLKAPVVENYTDRVMVRAEQHQSRTIAAVTQLRDQQVLVTPARTERRVIPATMRNVVETVEVTPERTLEEVTPALYQTRMERVMVRPARQEWVEQRGISTGAALVTPQDYQPVRYRGDGTLTWPGKVSQDVASNADTREYLGNGSGQTIYCLKDFAAEYKDVARQVEVRPQSKRHVKIAAVTKQVTRQVVDVAEHEQVVEIPAVYTTKKVMVEVEPARVETRTIPAIYRNETKQRVIQGAQPVWQEVLCERNATPAKVREIQKALKAKGYFKGPVNGVLGQSTVSAMQRFQADQGLPQGQISVESVRALGVSL